MELIPVYDSVREIHGSNNTVVKPEDYRNHKTFKIMIIKSLSNPNSVYMAFILKLDKPFLDNE